MNILLKRAPSGPLASVVRWIYAATGPIPGEVVVHLPSTRARLVWALPDQRQLVETRGRGQPQVIEGPTLYLPDTGIRSITSLGPSNPLALAAELVPGSAQAIVGAPLGHLPHSALALTEVWGAQAVHAGQQRLTEAMGHSIADAVSAFEDLLSERLRGSIDCTLPAQDALAALQAHGQDQRIEDVAARVGMNERQYRELVRRSTGLTPKRYLRLQRLANALRGLRHREAPTDTALAADCGYFDQAHFIHEFRSLVGMTPSEYRKRHGDGEHSACFFTTVRERLAALPWLHRRPRAPVVLAATHEET